MNAHSLNPSPAHQHKLRPRTAALWFLAIGLVTLRLSGADVSVHHLRTEYLRDPIGIDTPTPRLSWQIMSEARGAFQTAYALRFAHSRADLERGHNLIQDTGQVSSNQSIHLPYPAGKLNPRETVFWQVKVWTNAETASDWSEPALFEMGLLEPSQWTAAWIEADIEDDSQKSEPAHYFRRAFEVDEPPVRARLYVTSHGVYTASLNGSKVGDQVLTPGWTSYHHRLQYQVYDITDALRPGENVLGAIVGDGWYRGRMGWNGGRHYYGEKRGLLAQLEMTFADGRRVTVATDRSWQSSTGAILQSDLYDGEHYDARLERPGWNATGFDSTSWSNVNVTTQTLNNLVASASVPIRRIQEIKPVKVTPTGDNRVVVDLGQNMVGWVRLQLEGTPGQKITLRHAEELDDNGNFYVDNLRSAAQTDSYICRGDGSETFEPSFTFHGFRYVEVSGLSAMLEPGDITGIVVHSDLESIGSFSCSDPMLNQLQSNIRWGLKGNFLDIPSDCPQRDERMGWTGDAQAFAATACFLVNAGPFYSKWTRDMVADQRENGSITNVVPDTKVGGGVAGWGDAIAIVPWSVYQAYGDKNILRENYHAMVRWVDFMQQRAGDDLIWSGDYQFGDWLSFDSDRSDYRGATTSPELIATAYFAHTAELVAKIAETLGEHQDQIRLRTLSHAVAQAFGREFVTPAGRVMSDTQTAYVLALAFDLIPFEDSTQTADFLFKDVQKFQHLTTGFLGTPLIADVLTNAGRIDLAFDLLTRTEYPSWLYPITRGATTIWERWDGRRPKGGMQNPQMNSFNHYAYGAIGNWMYRHIGGIRIAEPGYKRIHIKPEIGGGISFADAEIRSVYGPISTHWELAATDFKLNVTIPANTSALIEIPGSSAHSVTEDGHPIDESDGITFVRFEDGRHFIEAGSGTYRFSSRLERSTP